MFSYDEVETDKIISCTLDDVDLEHIPPEDIFQVESKWKDRSLLYSTIQAYAAATGWKATLSHSIYIRCSCYNRPSRSEKKENLPLDHYARIVSGKSRLDQQRTKVEE